MAKAGGGGDGEHKPTPPSAPASVPLDISRGERAVWLLKVPPLVSKAWQQQTEAGSNLGKLVLTLDPTKPEGDNRQFSLELTSTEPSIPKSFILNSTKDLVPMYAFSETPQGKLAIEGKVEHKFDMKPNDFLISEYRKLCRERLDKSRIKNRTVRVLENDHGVYIRPQPVAIGPTYPTKKKAPVAKTIETKRIRIERVELEDLIFKLFEQQPHWSLKQLVAETQQPEAFLKEVMADLCNYNKRGPNQGKYELKPEYIRKPTDEDNPTG